MLKFSAHPISINYDIGLQEAINLVEQWNGTLLYTSRDVDGSNSIVLAFNPLKTITEDQSLESVDHLQNNHHFDFPWIFGYMGYDAKHLVEENGIYSNLRDTDFPLYSFHVYQFVFIFNQQWKLKNGYQIELNNESTVAVSIDEAFNFSKTGSDSFSVSNLQSHPDQDGFMQGVKSIQKYIRAGDVYQVNLTRKITADFTGDPAAAAKSLLESNRIEFGVFYKSEGRYLVSTSPERFFKTANGKILTSPIKGTAGRNGDDDMVSNQLLNDTKNLRELAMITDLLRNDISKICKPGTVKVKEFPILKTLKNVFHLVADVEGELAVSDFSAIMEALFPGGSITGCPKIRACQIIEELEQKGRGPYTGSFGYINGAGEMDFNILIRTVFIQNQKLSFNVGGGITLLSDPQDEYEETLHKAQNILKALGQ
ncbi:MAG TPA: anthranilate synthase component I family protein [Salinivirga sp.]|uniref:anthranilate synthase component I family protein n=1 Tax=Salinivirga sp. TaxID=1970192 RepID=UPI002B4899D3|nr:anthranilate synthase component I family protein [Salinivirga sp.]HKK59958.1 anthranilate synthase component I family protein [Salinivirga sp.]